MSSRGSKHGKCSKLRKHSEESTPNHERKRTGKGDEITPMRNRTFMKKASGEIVTVGGESAKVVANQGHT
jgi:hypothetical protein